MRSRTGSVDIAALYQALDVKRRDRAMTWRGVAVELQVSPSTLTRLASNQHPDVDAFARMTLWLGISADEFIVDAKKKPRQKQTMLTTIARQLRTSRELDTRHARAFLRVAEAAFNVQRAMQATEK